MAREDIDLLEELEKKLAKLEEVEKALKEKEAVVTRSTTAHADHAREAEERQKEIERLDAAKQDLQVEIQRLSDRKTELENQLTGMERDLGKMRGEHNTLQEEHHKLKVEAAGIARENRILADKTQTMASELRTVERALESTRNERSSLERERQVVKEECETAAKRLESMKKEETTLASSMSSMQLEVASLDKALKEQEKADREAKSEAEAIRKELIRKNQELEQALKKLERIRAEYANLELRINNFRNVEKELKNIQPEYRKVKEDFDKAKRESSELAKSIGQARKTLDDLKSETRINEKIEAALNENKKELAYTEDTLQTVRAELKEADGEFKKLQKELPPMRAEHESLLKAISENDSTRQLLETHKKELSVLDDKIREREARIAEIMDTLRVLESKDRTAIATLNQETQELAKAHEQYTGEIKRLQAQKTSLADEQNALNVELSGLRTKIEKARLFEEDMISKIEKRRGELVALDREMEDKRTAANSYIDQKSSVIENLKKELAAMERKTSETMALIGQKDDVQRTLNSLKAVKEDLDREIAAKAKELDKLKVFITRLKSAHLPPPNPDKKDQISF